MWKPTLNEVSAGTGAVIGGFMGGPIGALIGAGVGYGAGRASTWAMTKGLFHHKQAPASPVASSSNPITGPGTPQPPGPIALPVVTIDLDSPAADPLHAAAAALLTVLQTMTPTQEPFPECGAFQSQFNLTNPSPRLATDAKYGPKTQAALQSVIDPAVAPGNFFPSSVIVPGPATPAPAPTPNVDVQSAAAVLVAMGTIPTTSDARVTTFQHAYNLHPVGVKLTEDGKYGPMSQAGLQSVLDFAGGGQTAPTNGYGKVGAIPTFPG